MSYSRINTVCSRGSEAHSFAICDIFILQVPKFTNLFYLLLHVHVPLSKTSLCGVIDQIFHLC